MSTSWNGTPARHEDGRTGTLREFIGFNHVSLTIWSPQNEKIGQLQINADGPDQGDDGWSFLHETTGTWWPLANFDF